VRGSWSPSQRLVSWTPVGRAPRPIVSAPYQRSRGVRVDDPGPPAPLHWRMRLNRQFPIIPGRFAGRGRDRRDNAFPDCVIHPLTAPLVREIIPRRRPLVGEGEVRPALALLENVIELHGVRSLRCFPRPLTTAGVVIHLPEAVVAVVPRVPPVAVPH
jgi:hypothetical protein